VVVLFAARYKAAQSEMAAMLMISTLALAITVPAMLLDQSVTEHLGEEGHPNSKGNGSFKHSRRADGYSFRFAFVRSRDYRDATDAQRSARLHNAKRRTP
jgi:hypothetical protein